MLRCCYHFCLPIVVVPRSAPAAARHSRREQHQPPPSSDVRHDPCRSALSRLLDGRHSDSESMPAPPTWRSCDPRQRSVAGLPAAVAVHLGPFCPLLSGLTTTIVARWNEFARSSATRRHRSVDTGGTTCRYSLPTRDGEAGPAVRPRRRPMRCSKNSSRSQPHRLTGWCRRGGIASPRSRARMVSRTGGVATCFSPWPPVRPS